MVEFGNGECRIVQRNDSDAHQAIVCTTELRHAKVGRSRCTVTNLLIKVWIEGGSCRKLTKTSCLSKPRISKA